MEFDVDGRPFRLVRERLHLGPGRDPGDGPVLGHAEHPGPGRVHQRHVLFVVPVFGRPSADVADAVDVAAAAAASVVGSIGGERHGALDAPAHGGRVAVLCGGHMGRGDRWSIAVYDHDDDGDGDNNEENDNSAARCNVCDARTWLKRRGKNANETGTYARRDAVRPNEPVAVGRVRSLRSVNGPSPPPRPQPNPHHRRPPLFSFTPASFIIVIVIPRSNGKKKKKNQ